MLNRVKESKVWAFYTRWRLPLNLAVLALLLFGNCFWGGMVFIVYPVLLAMVCFDNFANAVTYLVAIIPFIALNGTLGYLFYLLCLFALAIKYYAIALCVEKSRPRPVILIVIGLLIIYCLLPIGPYNKSMWLKTALLLSVFVMAGVVTGKPEIVRLKLNIRILAITLLFTSVVGCLHSVIPHLSAVIPFVVTNGLSRFSGLFMHPNHLGTVCPVVVSLFAYLIISRQAKLGDYVLMLAVTALGFTSLSKNCLVLTAVVYAIILLWLLRHNWAPTVVVGLVVLTVVIGFCCTHNDMVSAYFGRFFGYWRADDGFTAFMNTLTTERWALWVGYCTFLWHNPVALFFGRGLGAGPVLVPVHGQYMSPHNFLLAMVYQIGLVGTALFVTALVLLIIAFKRRRPHAVHKAIWAPILILLLLLSVEDFILFIISINIV